MLTTPAMMLMIDVRGPTAQSARTNRRNKTVVIRIAMERPRKPRFHEIRLAIQ